MPDLFGTLNSTPVNGIAVDDGYEIIALDYNEFASNVGENVGVLIASQSLTLFSEDVQFQNTIQSSKIISITQSVHGAFEGKIITIGENVMVNQADSFFGRNGWEPTVTIDGYIIPRDKIYGNIIITKEENQSNQATFSVLVADPVGLIDQIWGKDITIDYVSTEGTTRMFTGVIAIPEIDLIEKQVNFTCSNNRDEIINNDLVAIVQTTGKYSEEVQGKVDTVAEEMAARMKTIPYSLDFDSYNNYCLNPWFAKTIADYEFDDADIYYRNPRLVWQDRTKIKNDYSINVKYQYTRLYHHERNFSWIFPYTFCQFLSAQYSLPSVKLIEDAITQNKWHAPNPIIFTSVFPPGFCVEGATILLWNTTMPVNKGTYSTVFDSEGNVVSDPDGNNVYGFKRFTTQDDLSKIYTIGAQWTGATRFSQYIEEDYTFTVHATQSIDQFGPITDVVSSSLKDDFDESQWEIYTSETPQPSNAVADGNGNYYFNQDTAPEKMTNAILTHLTMASADILSTHRNTAIIVETPIKPYLSLSHTIFINATSTTAKGKIQKLTHTLDLVEGKGSSTEVTVALFRSQGSADSTPLIAPTRPSDSVSFPTSTINLQNHYGITDQSYNGYIGNKNNPRVPGTLARTGVQEEFRVDSPAISDAYRQLKTLIVDGTYNVAIPNDLLTVSFS